VSERADDRCERATMRREAPLRSEGTEGGVLLIEMLSRDIAVANRRDRDRPWFERRLWRLSSL